MSNVPAEPIVFERLIDASPDEAFALLTQPERLRRWQAVSASVDLRIGGEYRLTVTPGHVANGTYVEIDPGRRVVYTWGWVDSPELAPGASTIIVDLEPDGAKTLVRITHEGLPADQVTGHSEGWAHYLERLGAAATSGSAGLDPWVMGTEEFDHLSAAEASWSLCHEVMLGFTDADRDRSTPCSCYTVDELVEHLMGSLRALGGMVDAAIPAEIDSTSAEDHIAQAAGPTLAAWRAHGVEGDVPFGAGRAPAAMPLGIISLEFFIHAWDFAQATGQQFDAPEPLTTFVADLADQIIQPDNRGEGKGFAEIATAAHDDAVTRLMAFTGRAT